MGVDTKGITKNKVSWLEVFDFIKDSFDGNATHDIWKEKESVNSLYDTGFITFNYKDEERKLMVVEVTDSNDYEDIDVEVGALWMSFRMWGSSVEIMEKIISHFGGYVDKDDGDGIGWESYN